LARSVRECRYTIKPYFSSSPAKWCPHICLLHLAFHQAYNRGFGYEWTIPPLPTSSIVRERFRLYLKWVRNLSVPAAPFPVKASQFVYVDAGFEDASPDSYCHSIPPGQLSPRQTGILQRVVRVPRSIPRSLGPKLRVDRPRESFPIQMCRSRISRRAM
jgi:hypothetical protein